MLNTSITSNDIDLNVKQTNLENYKNAIQKYKNELILVKAANSDLNDEFNLVKDDLSKLNDSKYSKIETYITNQLANFSKRIKITENYFNELLPIYTDHEELLKFAQSQKIPKTPIENSKLATKTEFTLPTNFNINSIIVPKYFIFLNTTSIANKLKTFLNENNLKIEDFNKKILKWSSKELSSFLDKQKPFYKYTRTEYEYIFKINKFLINMNKKERSKQDDFDIILDEFDGNNESCVDIYETVAENQTQNITSAKLPLSPAKKCNDSPSNRKSDVAVAVAVATSTPLNNNKNSNEPEDLTLFYTAKLTPKASKKIETDTTLYEIAERLKDFITQYSIPRAFIANAFLNKKQNYLSDMINHPKTWKTQRKLFLNAYKAIYLWLNDKKKGLELIKTHSLNKPLNNQKTNGNHASNLRLSLTNVQTNYLNEKYTANQYPTNDDLIKFEFELNIRKACIAKWFANRRYKEKITKKKTRLFSNEQINNNLEEIYVNDKNPSMEMINVLCEQTGLSVNMINNWFATRRSYDDSIEVNGNNTQDYDGNFEIYVDKNHESSVSSGHSNDFLQETNFIKPYIKIESD